MEGGSAALGTPAHGEPLCVDVAQGIRLTGLALSVIQPKCQLLDSYWVATCTTVYWGVVISTGSKRDAVFIERRVVSFDTL